MKYVVAVDQSTSGTKVALLDEKLHFVRILRKEHAQYYPYPGWAEHDAEEIWQNTAALLSKLAEGISKADIAGIGIANQRETTALWERGTGKPLHKAIVWQDVRAKDIASELADRTEQIRGKTGLLPSPYYSAAKAAAVLRADPQLSARAARGEVCIGTIDSYLLYRLTAGKSFASDYSNASRTQLFNLERLCWDKELCDAFQIPYCSLADSLMPNDGNFGTVTALPALEGIPIVAMAGDSHASLYGHGCFTSGMVKTSYGTGSSIMMNIGEKPVLSKHGLSTSVGFAAGGKVCYVLEGNITCSADTLIWLRDSMQLISGMEELKLAETVPDTDGVYLVPAFSGLGAPWFDEKARGVICGMNRGTTKAHIIRAALASIAHQNADVLDAMMLDTGTPVRTLRADGGGSVNPLLMQMQSDYVPCEVAVSSEKELTLAGIAGMAAVSAGLTEILAAPTGTAAVYKPQMGETERFAERAGWGNALQRAR